MAPVTVTGHDVDNPATTLRFPSATGLPVGVILKDNLDGTATIKGAPTANAGTYNVAVTVTDGVASASVPVTLTVTRENALVLYSGEWLAQLGSTPLPMRATVMDSAAVGYTGANPEVGAGATIGDITKVKVAFEVFGGTSCTGTPTQTVEAWVTDGPTAGDGIGTATASLTNPGGSNEVTYCVRAGIAGDYYTGDNAQTAGVSFYQNSGQFATGGGWIVDPNRGKGNFGFNGRYTKQGAPKGQMVYVFRDSYNGVQADFVMKSSAITQLAFGGTAYPISATLQGKASIQIIGASDGALLYGDGNATFISQVVDSGKSSGIGSDSFSLAVYDKNGVQYKAVPTTVLSGGNVVVHSK
jgi:hypothetical protein